MDNIKTVRTAIKQIAQQIENLAQQVQANVDQDKDIIMPANELARNISTFVFSLGEMYALEQGGKKVKASTVSNPNNTSRNYHNKRDALGRFARA